MKPVAKIPELDELVDVVYNAALEQGLNNKTLAAKAGLTYETVRRLGNRETSYPRLQTVYLLARAVGLTLVATRLRARKAG